MLTASDFARSSRLTRVLGYFSAEKFVPRNQLKYLSVYIPILHADSWNDPSFGTNVAASINFSVFCDNEQTGYNSFDGVEIWAAIKCKMYSNFFANSDFQSLLSVFRPNFPQFPIERPSKFATLRGRSCALERGRFSWISLCYGINFLCIARVEN